MSPASDPEEGAAVQRLLSLQGPQESDAAFAKRVGIAPQVLSNYKNRHHGLSLKSALRVHQHAGVSLDWLLAGRGSPELADGAVNGDRPFEEGGRFVYDRLLRSVLEMTDAVERAGMVSDDEASRIREPIERYLNGGDGTEER